MLSFFNFVNIFIFNVTDFLKSAKLLERLNLTRNALSEFDGAILSHSKQIIELDLSHNQITTLKLNEVVPPIPFVFLWCIRHFDQSKIKF